MPGPESRSVYEVIRDDLDELNLPYWGFVFVRCTYKDQQKWEIFISLLQRLFEESLPPDKYYSAGSEAAKAADLIKDRLAWTIIEDRDALAGASDYAASERFAQWRDSEGVTEAGDWFLKDHRIRDSCTRYSVFVYVDEPSIESVVNPATFQESKLLKKFPILATFLSGYFTLVNASTCLGEESTDESDEDEEVEDESFTFTSADWLAAEFAFLCDLENWYEVIKRKSTISMLLLSFPIP